jgi:LemA protein
MQGHAVAALCRHTRLDLTISILHALRSTMHSIFQRWIALLVMLTALSLTGCGYNQFQSGNEQVKASWSEVLSQYQRRADLVPNLVNIVKGQADFESSTLQAVVQARAKATAIQASPELVNNPQAFQKFQLAQNDLSGSLSRLLVVAERYPTLRANQGFIDLQAQLEGTENRIAVARNRYIKAVQDYNVTIHSFPSNLTAWVLGYQEKPNFSVDNEQAIAKPPVVNFEPAAPSARTPSSGVTR